MVLSYSVLFAGLFFSSAFLPLQGIQNSSTSDWVKMNNQAICFQTRGNRFGSFRNFVRSGMVAALKLEHVSGHLACAGGPTYNSRWGCNNHSGLRKNPLNVVVTDQLDNVIFPKKNRIRHPGGMWYWAPFADSASPRELVFSDFAQPFYFPKYKQMRIWYGEDLKGYTEHDNHGRACVNVYAKFML